MNRWRGR